MITKMSAKMAVVLGLQHWDTLWAIDPISAAKMALTSFKVQDERQRIWLWPVDPIVANEVKAM